MSKYQIHNKYLDITLYPNYSSNKNSLILIFLIFNAIIITFSFYFISLGAWPVSGFLGLDIILVYIAFKTNYYNNNIYERILLKDELIIFKLLPNGTTKKIFIEPTWLKIIISSYNNKGYLTLRSRGTSVKIGSFLNKKELLSLSQEIKSALVSREKNIINF